ncbi:pyridoxal phosphate-dependent aminotransferase [Serpentinicella alkaliphila]|uniref:Aminotransferase n=1 Tax=Serpentinicella alkaliphila TaxID=1734049 RepID=A0A4R2THV3_9FIRM|nr:pyridoxal phosphate-dependent aminotransferase [Serpentinicella alkaliphila]TCP96798.1 L-aspartate aminotransferase [Serpentinicella alkaliphila]
MNIQLSRKHNDIAPSVTLFVDAKAKEMQAKGINVIGFGVGEPDFRTPENIRKRAIYSIENENLGYTPASGLQKLKEAICDKLKLDNGLEYKMEHIIVSNGAKHSLYNAFQAICNPGDEVIIPSPYWVSYPEMVKMADAIPVFIDCPEEKEFKLDIKDLKNAITSKTKAMILNSPSNPTGSVYTKEELEEIAKVAVEKNIIVISDEIYEKLIYDDATHVSIASLNDRIKDLTIVVNGMAKAYAMTGWRIGYTASNAQIAKIMGNIQSHATSNPNTIAQYASIEALSGDQTAIENMRLAFDERRKYMVDRINKIPGLSCIVPKGAFYIMMNISQYIGKEFNGNKIKGSLDFADLLLEHAHVAIVPGAAFGVDQLMRISYANSMDNIKEGLTRLENFLPQLK